jgi:hypothetical protein
MKISKEEALEAIDDITKLAKVRMKNGIEKYGEDLVLESPSNTLQEEFDQEIADALNYLIFAYIKGRSLISKIELLNDQIKGDNK